METQTDNEIAKLIEAIELDIAIATNDLELVRQTQETSVRKIFGEKHDGKLHVREAMDGIFGRKLSEEDFEKYYPIYTLGFQTGRSLGYTKMLQSLKWLLYLLGKPIKKQVKA